MANGNDPANIPYIIGENGFYYVAYKEKVKVPEIVVSAKGVANGLSEEYNDGWDFGPDSYSPTSTSAIPYTQTTGLQEALNYAWLPNSVAGTLQIIPEIHLLAGRYDIYTNIIIKNDGNNALGPVIRGDLYNTTYIFQNTPSTDIFTITGYNLNSMILENLYLRFDGLTSTGNGITVNASTGDIALVSGYMKNITVYNTDTTHYGILFNDGTLYFNMENIQMNINGGGVSWNLSSSSAGNCIWRDFVISVIGSDTVSLPPTLNISGVSGTIPTWFLLERIELTNNNPNASVTAFQLEYLRNTSVIGLDIENTGNASNFSGFYISNCVQVGMNEVDILGVSGNTGGSFVSSKVIANNMRFDNSALPLYIKDSSNVVLIEPYQVDISSPSNYPKIIHVIPATVTLTANPPVSGTVYQNTNPYDIEIDLPVYATTSGTAGYVTLAKGLTSSSLTTIGNQFVNGSTSSTSVDIIRLRVPAGWYYEFTASGVTFGTASVFAD